MGLHGLEEYLLYTSGYFPDIRHGSHGAFVPLVLKRRDWHGWNGHRADISTRLSHTRECRYYCLILFCPRYHPTAFAVSPRRSRALAGVPFKPRHKAIYTYPMLGSRRARSFRLSESKRRPSVSRLPSHIAIPCGPMAYFEECRPSSKQARYPVY